MKNIAVIFGGKSPEHDISIITGVLTANSVNEEVYNVFPIYIDKQGIWRYGEALKKLGFYKLNNFKNTSEVFFKCGENVLYKKTKAFVKKIAYIDCAIVCSHGLNGEDGSIVALLNLCNVATCSPDLFASSLAIDKDFTKIALKGLDIPCLPYVRVFRANYYEKKQLTVKYLVEKLGFPLIIKPARLGSSIGIKKVDSEENLHFALAKAFEYDDKIICESYLRGATDINCAVYKLNNQIITSQLEQADSENDILTFNDKYSGGKNSISKNFPANLDENTTKKIKQYTEKIYRKLDFNGICRFDFLICDGEVYLNELNAIPGSLAYYLFCDRIKDFSALLGNLIENAIKKQQNKQKLKSVYNSNVLFQEGINYKK